MKRIILFLAFAFCLARDINAQNLKFTPEVIPTQGGYGGSGNLFFSWTIGEPAQTTIKNGNLKFTQGFQQPEKPLPPVAPASQTVCSDTAVTFVFTNRITGKGADQVEWSYFPDFRYSYFNGTDSTLKITVPAGQTDTIYFRSRISGNKLFSDSIVSAVLKVNYKPQPPAPPAPAFVFSDTAYTFHFLKLNPGVGGNALEWSLDSSFTTSWLMTCFDTILNDQDTSSCTITVTVHPNHDTLIFVRCIDTISGCISEIRRSIAIVDTFETEHTRHFDTLSFICTGTSFNLPIPSSDHHKRYDLRVDTSVVASIYGNDSLLVFNTGAIDSNTKFNVLATDTGTHSTVYIDTSVVIIVVGAVDTPEFMAGDTLIDKTDTVWTCYYAVAPNAELVKYTIVSGNAVIDSGSGCLISAVTSFTVRATAYGLPGCDTLTADLHVTVNNISAPIPPNDVFLVIDTPGIATVTFDTVRAGTHGNKIEWSGSKDFGSSHIDTSPAVISFSMLGPADSIIYLRTVDSKSGARSQARSARALLRLATLSTGLIDKTAWKYYPQLSDEFSYSQSAPNPTLPRAAGFLNKWYMQGTVGTPTAHPNECVDYIFPSDHPNISIADYAAYNASAFNDPNISGNAGEVTFKDGICHLQGTKLSTAGLAGFTYSCDGHTFHIAYKSAMMTLKEEYTHQTPLLIEFRAKLPTVETVGGYHLGVGTLWDDNINVMEAQHWPGHDGAYPGHEKWTNQNVYRGKDDGWSTSCGRFTNYRTHCADNEDWRTYSCMINHDNIIFFEDGKETYSMRRSDYFPASESAGHHVRLGIGMDIYGELSGYDSYAVAPGQQNNYDFQIDYVRTYTPSLPYCPSPICSLSTPPIFQNIQSGVPKTLESPNRNGQAYNEELVSSQTIKAGTKISILGSGTTSKIYFWGNNGIGYEASKPSSTWITKPLYQTVIRYSPFDFLHLFGLPMADYGNIEGSLTAANNGRVYFQSNNHKLKYFEKIGSNWRIKIANTNWNTFPVMNCSGNTLTDDQNRLWYKDSHNNIQCWNPFYNQSSPVTTNGSVSGNFVVAKCGCLIFYQKSNGNIDQMWWLDNNWNVIPDVVGAGTATSNLAMDEDHSRLYFIDANDLIQYYNWDYTSKNISSSALTVVGYKNHDGNNNVTLCAEDKNANSDLTLSYDKSTIFYKSNEENGTHGLWYYFNDREPYVPLATDGPNWNETTRDVTGASTEDEKVYGRPIQGSVTTEQCAFGRLFYAGIDGRIYEANWVPADYYTDCSDVYDPKHNNYNDKGKINMYKTDSLQTANGPPFKGDSSNTKAKAGNKIKVDVIPNPSKDIFTFNIQNIQEGSSIQLSVTDISGRAVYNTTVKTEDNSPVVRLTWMATSVEKGVYFYSIKMNNEISTGKLVKL